MLPTLAPSAARKLTEHGCCCLSRSTTEATGFLNRVLNTSRRACSSETSRKLPGRVVINKSALKTTGDGGAEAIIPTSKDFYAAELAVREKFVPEIGRIPAARRYFPKHMHIAMIKMNAHLRHMDVIVEIHDARIPLTGRNEDFEAQMYRSKPHILILNKVDLVKNLVQREPKVTAILKHRFGIKHVFWTSMATKPKLALCKIRNAIIEEARSAKRFERTYENNYTIMVCGIPNVGKSTFINEMRAEFFGKAGTMKVLTFPGSTVKIHQKVRISENPLMYIVDTPGVLAPTAEGNGMMKLFAINGVQAPSHILARMNPEIIVDYLIWHLNKNHRYEYALDLGLEPTDSAYKFLKQYARAIRSEKSRSSNHVNKTGGFGHVIDTQNAAYIFIDRFRAGKIGDQFLDDDRIQEYFNEPIQLRPGSEIIDTSIPLLDSN